jgi:protein-tyrosine phosphatase
MVQAGGARRVVRACNNPSVSRAPHPGCLPTSTGILTRVAIPILDDLLDEPTEPSPSPPSPRQAPPGPAARARRWAGRVRRRLGSRLDGLLHPWRRRRALASLAGIDVDRVLFVCLGNVCRSPYAEHRFRALLEDRGLESPAVGSAGFIGPGRAAPAPALATAERRGLDLGTHRSRVLDEGMAAESGLIVLVDAAHARRLRALPAARHVRHVVLGDLDPETPRTRTIRDPWGEDPLVFQRVFTRLDRCLRVLVDVLTREPVR